MREYFGDDDECHMAYHFPLMPRMYMAIAQEDRHPVVEILQQTPDISPSCQWAIFLRNHDELTLEMVTSKERDYMYSMYAADPRARINLGIRRRLAPLLENDRERIKLMNSLLLSMPGSPVLYYGDEIGMGDNIFLGDRDGVRTPMQWTSDRNGGFSRADPQRLYLPPIQDPVYGYEAVNVEAQSRDASSLLNWTRRLLAVRRSTRVFGRGRITMLHPGNRKILAYLRELGAEGGEAVLCVANLSRSAQPVELDLARFKGRVPVEMGGRIAFPPVGELPYLLTLPAYGFFWFRLATDAAPPDWHLQRLPVEDLAVLVLFDGWNSLFRDRVVPWRIAMATKTLAQFEGDLLPRFLARQPLVPWRFRGARQDPHRGTCRARARWPRVAADPDRRAVPERNRRAGSRPSRWVGRTVKRNACVSSPRPHWPRCARRRASACWPTRWPTRRSATLWFRRLVLAARSGRQREGCGSSRHAGSPPSPASRRAPRGARAARPACRPTVRCTNWRQAATPRLKSAGGCS